MEGKDTGDEGNIGRGMAYGSLFGGGVWAVLILVALAVL